MMRMLAQFDRGVGSAVGWIAHSRIASVLLLVSLCLMLYLPGIATLPVTDRDEARFAQATKQMLETGDFIDIRFQGDPRYKKPIGIHWLQAASVSALSPDNLTEIWAYRVPSLIGIIVAVLLTWWAARPIFGRRTALLAAILLAGAFTLALEARIAKSDAVLLACVTLAQGALVRLYMFRGNSRGMTMAAVLFWGGLGLGTMVKGPVAPGLALLTALPLIIFDRDRSWLRNLRILWGLPLMLAITLPWFITIGIVSDWEFYRLALGEDFAAKLHSGQEMHWGPPGFYFVLFWWSFWPAALVATSGAALWLWRHRANRRAGFLLSWIIPFWLILEATPTKLPHYSMVLYPAIAMAAAWVLRDVAMTGALRLRTYKQGAFLWAVVAALQVGFLIFALFYFEIWPSPSAYALAAGVIAFAGVTFIAGWTARFHAAIVTALITAALLYTAAFRFVLPSIDPVWLSRQTAEAVAVLRPCMSGPLVLTRYREPSAVFLLGTDTVMTSAADANTALSEGKIGVALFRSDDFAKLPLVDPPPRPIGCIDGFNLNGGLHMRLQFVTAKPESDFAACQLPEKFRCGRSSVPQ